MATKNLRLVEFLVACVLVSIGVLSAHARSWTTAELDTLSDREWMWVDKHFKDQIPEEYSEVERPEKIPERFRYCTAEYPKVASKLGIEGSVWLRVLIDERGKVRAARVLEDSGSKIGFEEAALAAARKSVWKPAAKDGSNVAMWVKYEVAFCLRATKEGDPIRIVDLWHWKVRSANLMFVDSVEWEERYFDSDSTSEDYVRTGEYPSVIKYGKLDYPTVARIVGIEGSVWVKALVMTSGDVSEVMVVRDSGSKYGLEEGALYSAINTKWKPAKQDNVPINIWVTYEVKFQLKR